jgi:hypothetical protein
MAGDGGKYVKIISTIGLFYLCLAALGCGSLTTKNDDIKSEWLLPKHSSGFA